MNKLFMTFSQHLTKAHWIPFSFHGWPVLVLKGYDIDVGYDINVVMPQKKYHAVKYLSHLETLFKFSASAHFPFAKYELA